jgi:hypothetical protein
MNHIAKHKMNFMGIRGLIFGLLSLTAISFATLAFPVPAYAAYQCGSGQNAVQMSIDVGCQGSSCRTTNTHGCSALVDATFAIIRFLSAGVGIIIIGSTVWAGVQYASSRDDPSMVSKAKDRIRSNIFALLLFIFGYALLNYIIPAGFFR